MRSSVLVFSCLLSCGAALGGAATTEPSFVFDFESGIAGWITNDAMKYSGRTQDTPLVSIAPAEDGHPGKGSLDVTFHVGEGWAGAYILLADVRDQ